MKVMINEGVGESQKVVTVSGNFIDCFNMLSQLGYIGDGKISDKTLDDWLKYL